jgi:hypothetical protein
MFFQNLSVRLWSASIKNSTLVSNQKLNKDFAWQPCYCSTSYKKYFLKSYKVFKNYMTTLNGASVAFTSEVCNMLILYMTGIEKGRGVVVSTSYKA